MKPLGVKTPFRNILGSKSVNRGMKFGAKALGYIGDLAPVAIVAGFPEAAPALENAKMASIALNATRRVITGRK